MERIKLINEKYGEISEKKAYLTETDYHVIKESETRDAEAPYITPPEIKEQRRQARENINRLQSEIELLIDEINSEPTDNPIYP